MRREPSSMWRGEVVMEVMVVEEAVEGVEMVVV